MPRLARVRARETLACGPQRAAGHTGYMAAGKVVMQSRKAAGYPTALLAAHADARAHIYAPAGPTCVAMHEGPTTGFVQTAGGGLLSIICGLNTIMILK